MSTPYEASERKLFDAVMAKERPIAAQKIADGTADVDLKAEWLTLFTGWKMHAAIAADASDNPPREITYCEEEWITKTNWVQADVQKDLFPLAYLGQHRADIMRDEIARLRRIAERVAPTVLPHPIGYAQRRPIFYHDPYWVSFLNKPAPENGYEPVALYSEDQVRDILAARPEPVIGHGASELPPLPVHPEHFMAWTAGEQRAIAAYGQLCIDSRPRSEDSRAKVQRDPARWYVWHNNQEAEGANLMEVLRNGKNLRTEAEALMAAQNVMAALEQERIEEMMERARKEHPECFEACDKLAGLASTTPQKAENE